MKSDADLASVYASVAVDILSIVLNTPRGLSPDGVVHIHEITSGFPVHEQLRSRQAWRGDASVQYVWHEPDNPFVTSDQCRDYFAPKIDFHLGVALLPWSNPEQTLQVSDRVGHLGWDGCMDRVIVVASTIEVIRDLEFQICDGAEMMVTAPVEPSMVRVDSFRFMAAVICPFPVGH